MRRQGQGPRPIKTLVEGKLRAWDLGDSMGDIKEAFEAALHSYYDQEIKDSQHQIYRALQSVAEATRLLRLLEEIGEDALDEIKSALKAGLIPSLKKRNTG